MSKKVAYSAVLIALAMIFSYVESLVPIHFGIPGVKLGLANLVVLVGLEFMSPVNIFFIMIGRILLSSMMFGNFMSVLYSLAGGILSFLVMLLVRQFKNHTLVQMSVLGGVTHNLGQILVAMLVVENVKLIYYFPALLVAGTISGLIVGIVGERVLVYLKKNKNFS